MAYALAHSPKSVQTEAKGLARAAASRARKAASNAQRVKAPLLGVAGAGLLGLAERWAPGVQLAGLDNGVTVGLPTVVAGVLLPGAAGEWLMLAGSGILASGARTMARTVGAAETEGF